MNRLIVVTVFGLMAASAQAASLPSSCFNSCSPQCQRDLNDLQFEIHSFMGRFCNPGPAPHPGPGPGGETVSLYHSDSCASDLVANVGQNTDCDAMGRTISERIYGVRIGGRCYDISDMSFTSACNVFKGGSRGTRIYHSDSCGSELMGTVSRWTDCRSFGQALGSTRAYGVEVGGRCYDISDTSAEAACTAFQGGDRGVKFFHSDSCSSELIAVVSNPQDCARYGTGMARVYGVEINGQCQDISDLEFQAACSRFAGSR